MADSNEANNVSSRYTVGLTQLCWLDLAWRLQGPKGFTKLFEYLRDTLFAPWVDIMGPRAFKAAPGVDDDLLNLKSCVMTPRVTAETGWADGGDMIRTVRRDAPLLLLPPPMPPRALSLGLQSVSVR